MEGLLLSILKIAAGVAIGLPLVIYLVQDKLLFFPQRPDDARRADIARRFPHAKSVSIDAADGTRLHAWWVTLDATSPGPLVIYFGGNAEEVSWMLEDIGDPASGITPGIGWLLIDYRGYGASGGAPSETALVADALAWYDHATRQPGVDRARIFVFGRSLGSGVAVQLAAQRALRAVVLVTPFDSLAAVAKRHYRFLPVDWMLKHRFESDARAGSIDAPLLAVLAGRDEVIPPAHGERLLAAWRGPKRETRIAGASHNDIQDFDEYWKSIRAFIVESAK